MRGSSKDLNSLLEQSNLLCLLNIVLERIHPRLSCHWILTDLFACLQIKLWKNRRIFSTGDVLSGISTEFP